MRKYFSQATLKEIATLRNIGKITASTGVAYYCLNESPKAFSLWSDPALYFVKNGGRNSMATEPDIFSMLP
ncbi:MAG TPA: hypothetical protein PK125_00935 [Syntrophorhabdus sp.]|jgi:GGDEF domain-containing protein|nr:hypothetical protein [Syntrophorhabdus sp.]MDI9558115.1 hypothetical protein [Pseudomonadota bacterium]OPX93824.1 MAG: hypothetical protein A4E59_02444 [Syntrophorhabdus sp. PtaB.Bin027]OQB77890.1 MAG: hypothetical protein BWX92_00531 [Deltaproteobacteria bacterium ADurb.Bin135]MBP8745529.1 hypothetical protein [Syntrophorhabdus sp.]